MQRDGRGGLETEAGEAMTFKTTRMRAALRQGRNDWYKITNNAATGIADLHIYDEIGYFGITAADLIAELSGLDASAINMHLSSPGGEVFDGIAIYNALRSHNARVTTYVDSLAASIASVIAMAGDEIIMQPHSQMMIHDGSGVCIGNAADMRELADLLDRQSDNIAGVYAERAGGTTKQWRARMQIETWYTAQEAVDAGLADRVAKKPQRMPDEDIPARDIAASWDLSVFRHAGREHAPPPDVTPVAAVAMAVHHTATQNSAWDGPAAEAAMPNEAAVLRYCHAWRDAGGDPDAKGTYKFPHHRHEGGPANLAACRNGLARLSGADIPDSDRAGVEAHLRAHLSDGGSDDGGSTSDHVHLEDDDLAGYDPDVVKAALTFAADGFHTSFDPIAFRSEVARAAGFDLDTEGFRAAMEHQAAESAAAAGIRQPPRPAEPEPATPPAPAPAPEPSGGIDPDVVRAAIEYHSGNAPAPPARPAPPTEQDPYDATTVTRAIREAIR